MELTFIQKSLGYYGRETAAGKTLEELCTQQITNAYSPSAVDADFNISFQAMQKVLSDARRATAVQFLCFRPTSLKSDDLKGGGSKRMHQNDRESTIKTRKG
jgi:exocyst complex component 2